MVYLEGVPEESTAAGAIRSGLNSSPCQDSNKINGCRLRVYTVFANDASANIILLKAIESVSNGFPTILYISNGLSSVEPFKTACKMVQSYQQVCIIDSNVLNLCKLVNDFERIVPILYNTLLLDYTSKQSTLNMIYRNLLFELWKTTV